jgi:hypothetical protein
MENNFELSSKYDLAIHARRGDYVSNPKTREFHGYCGESYFQKSLEVIESLDHSIRTVLVSSDDSVFAHHLANLARRFFPRVSILEEPSALKALVHLSNSRIFVGSNSTFSWWAGYLYPKEIRVFPRNWFRSHKVDFSHDFLFFDDPILLDELLES